MSADPELLRTVCDAARELVAAAPAQPATVRVQAADIVVEMAWANTAATAPVTVAAPAPAPAEEPATAFHSVRAATVGTFYQAPEPGAKPFVTVGAVVQAGQQVGILEAMKLMMPVEADVAGEIADILADGTPVEFDQPLVGIRPLG
jgi:acetyl-CoA carboxylase biotin carboxyl carrier protein